MPQRPLVGAEKMTNLNRDFKIRFSHEGLNWILVTCNFSSSLVLSSLLKDIASCAHAGAKNSISDMSMCQLFHGIKRMLKSIFEIHQIMFNTTCTTLSMVSQRFQRSADSILKNGYKMST